MASSLKEANAVVKNNAMRVEGVTQHNDVKNSDLKLNSQQSLSHYYFVFILSFDELLFYNLAKVKILNSLLIQNINKNTLIYV